MKVRIFAFAFFIAAVVSAQAGTTGYAQCGTYDAYLILYKTTARFEELGKLRCGEKLEIVSHANGYSEVRTLDSRLGWVRDADLSDTPPPARREFTFGLTADQPTDVHQNPAPKRVTSALTNEDIFAMRTKHAGSDLILKQIKPSRCAFDTSPEALKKLKASGLSDKVILAMLEAPVASEANELRAPETVDVKVPDGTPIEVELNGNVSPEEAQEGAIVEMSAAEDLVVNGVPVVLRGSAARARIIAVKQPGSRGGSGEVAWFMQDIVATSGERIPVTFAPKQPGNLHTRNFEGYPFFLSEFHKDTPAIKAADKRFRVVIHGDTVLSIPQSLAADVSAPKQKSQPWRQVSAKPALPSEDTPPPQPSEQTEAKP